MFTVKQLLITLVIVLGFLLGYAVFSESDEPNYNTSLIEETTQTWNEKHAEVPKPSLIVRDAVREEIRDEAAEMTAVEFYTGTVISADSINAKIDTNDSSPINVLDVVMKGTQAFQYILKDADKTLNTYLKDKGVE